MLGASLSFTLRAPRPAPPPEDPSSHARWTLCQQGALQRLRPPAQSSQAASPRLTGHPGPTRAWPRWGDGERPSAHPRKIRVTWILEISADLFPPHI